MKNNVIIGCLLLILIILYIINRNKNGEYFSTAENSCSCTPNSNEAIQNIAEIYSNKNDVVNFNNMNVINNSNINNLDSNNAQINNIKIKNNLIVDGKTILNNLNVSNIYSNNIDVSGNINTNGSILINNKSMVTWRQQILWGRPQIVNVIDPSGNLYNANEWFIYASGWNINGIGICQPFIDPTSNNWFLRVWAINDPNDNYIDIIAIPTGYFSNIFTSTFT